MNRIDHRTVELTRLEQEAEASFDDLLDIGYGLIEAARAVRLDYPSLSDDFIDWLVA